MRCSVGKRGGVKIIAGKIKISGGVWHEMSNSGSGSGAVNNGVALMAAAAAAAWHQRSRATMWRHGAGEISRGGIAAANMAAEAAEEMASVKQCSMAAKWQ
jgi:hypothetical protein